MANWFAFTHLVFVTLNDLFHLLTRPLDSQTLPRVHVNIRCLFNAVKCNLTQVTTGSTSFTRAVSGLLDMRMRQDSSCSWSIGHCSSFVGILVSVLLSVSVFPERGDSLEAVSPPPLFYQCDGCLFFFSPSVWGLMAGLPGFASHGSGLHLGAGCQ